MTPDEFHALAERMIAAEDFQEYLAAMITSATYNVHRAKHAPFMQPDMFMYRRQARREAVGAPAPRPVPVPMRIARPGECPPSSRPPGTNDDVIERFDEYARRRKRG